MDDLDDPVIVNHIHNANIMLLHRINANSILQRTETYKILYEPEELTDDVKEMLKKRNITYCDTSVLLNPRLCSLPTDCRFLNQCCVGLYRNQWADMYRGRMKGLWNNVYCRFLNYYFRVEISFWIFKCPMISPLKYTQDEIARVYTKRTVRLCNGCMGEMGVLRFIFDDLFERECREHDPFGRYSLSVEERIEIGDRYMNTSCRQVTAVTEFTDNRRLRRMVYDEDYNMHSHYIKRRTFFCDRCHICLISKLDFLKYDPDGTNAYLHKKVYDGPDYQDLHDVFYDHKNYIFDYSNKDYGFFSII